MEEHELKRFRENLPMVKLAKYMQEVSQGEKISGYDTTSGAQGRCVGCGGGATSSIVLKTESGKEYKVPVDGDCYAEFKGTLLQLSVENSLEEIHQRVMRNSTKL
jgi:hypothetical protein